MKYPLKWKDLVTVEVADDSVCFSYGDIKLFDLLFDSDEGYLLGTYDGTQIKIISYDFDKDILSEDTKDMSNTVFLQNSRSVSRA